MGIEIVRAILCQLCPRHAAYDQWPDIGTGTTAGWFIWNAQRCQYLCDLRKARLVFGADARAQRVDASRAEITFGAQDVLGDFLCVRSGVGIGAVQPLFLVGPSDDPHSAQRALCVRQDRLHLPPW
jgi:hypothetical protein